MKLIGSRSLALTSALFVATVSGKAATSPRYGGTLRVELHALTLSLDPREWKAGSLDSATEEQLATLVFDRLVVLDNYGRFQPQLAAEWSHDAQFKRWQFTIRSGVKFSDGTALTANDVVVALQPLLPDTLKVSSSSSAVVFQSSTGIPDLLEQLASGHFFVYRVLPSGALVGTGPFVTTDAPASAGPEKNAAATGTGSTTETVSRSTSTGTHLHFRANEEAWSGRPFVDGIEVTLGVPPLRAMFDLQIGKADLVELAPELVRRATQANLRVWTSAPVTLYALRFDDAQPAASDARLREALSLSLDRGTMANVLLQKQAESAAALLPQWLSGYAFLFNVDTNLERAKELRGTLPANSAAGTEPLRLRVDAPSDLAKLLGERVAVNARQAAILVQVTSGPVQHTAASTASAPAKPIDPQAGVHLFAWHYSSLSPRAELDLMLAANNLTELSDSSASSADPEQLYARERRILEDRRILPLVAQPEFVGLGPNVRDWMPARWGEWHLADVWLDLPEPAPARPDASNPVSPAAHSSSQPRATAPGAKP